MGRDSVRQAIQDLLAERGSFQSGELAERTGLSRQALNRHLRRALAEGRLVREGRSRAIRYRAPGTASFERAYPTAGLQEDDVAREAEAWLGGTGLEHSDHADRILTYAVSELVNNVIDHSGAVEARVRAVASATRIQIAVVDEGIGAFERLRRGLDLDDHLHAIQELSKGKATTEADRHTGEGLFFTSKMVDRFRLTANGLEWLVDNAADDQCVREVEERPGTAVELELSPRTRLAPVEVFRRYTHDFQFDTTRCVVRLFQYGRAFVSRSEAKRLLANLDRFREVILDFRGVETVGQGFVDEIFRIWARAHPEVRLIPRAMNGAVEFMVRRGLSGRGPVAEGPSPR